MRTIRSGVLRYAVDEPTSGSIQRTVEEKSAPSEIAPYTSARTAASDLKASRRSDRRGFFCQSEPYGCLLRSSSVRRPFSVQTTPPMDQIHRYHPRLTFASRVSQAPTALDSGQRSRKLSRRRDCDQSRIPIEAERIVAAATCDECRRPRAIPWVQHSCTCVRAQLLQQIIHKLCAVRSVVRIPLTDRCWLPLWSSNHHAGERSVSASGDMSNHRQLAVHARQRHGATLGQHLEPTSTSAKERIDQLLIRCGSFLGSDHAAFSCWPARQGRAFQMPQTLQYGQSETRVPTLQRLLDRPQRADLELIEPLVRRR